MTEPLDILKEGLIPVHTLFAIFLIFSYQEINNKIREAYNNFRDWVKLRLDLNNQERVLLQALGIDKEPDSWLEKDVIFQIFYFYKNVFFNNIELYKKASKDYYFYAKEYLKFKKYIFRLFIWFSVLMFLIILSLQKIEIKYPQKCYLMFLSYYVVTIWSIFIILRGPKPGLFNNAIENRKNDACLKGAEKEIEGLKKLVHHI